MAIFVLAKGLPTSATLKYPKKIFGYPENIFQISLKEIIKSVKSKLHLGTNVFFNIMIFQPHNLSGTNYLWTKISGLGKKLKFSIEVEKQ